MSLPRPEDLGTEIGTEEERAEALQVAIRVVELLIGGAVLFRDRVQKVLLGGAEPCVLLEHFPIDHLTIDGTPSPRGFWVEEGTGVVGTYLGVPTKTYKVGYRIGCEHSVPVILEELVRMVAESILGADVDASEVLMVGASAQALTDLAVKDRESFREKLV